MVEKWGASRDICSGTWKNSGIVIKFATKWPYYIGWFIKIFREQVKLIDKVLPMKETWGEFNAMERHETWSLF